MYMFYSVMQYNVRMKDLSKSIEIININNNIYIIFNF